MKVDYKYTMNGREQAARMFNRDQDHPVLEIEAQFDTGEVKVEISVLEAEKFARELLEYAKEIREAAQ